MIFASLMSSHIRIIEFNVCSDAIYMKALFKLSHKICHMLTLTFATCFWTSISDDTETLNSFHCCNSSVR